MNRSFREAARRLYLRARQPALHRLVRRNRTSIEIRRVHSLFVMSQERLGDVCLQAYALGALRSANPHLALGIVAPGPYHGLLRWYCRPQWIVPSPTDRFERRQIGYELRSYRWDAGVDLTTDYHLAPARLTRQSEASETVGFVNAGREAYFTHRVEVPSDMHMADVFRLPWGRLGLRMDAQWSVPQNRSMPYELPGRKPGGLIVGLHPGATHATQRWPLRHYGELAGMLTKSGNRVVVFGSSSECALVEEIFSAVDRGGARGDIEICIVDDLLRFARTLEGLDTLVCNNSGPLHLAGLVGTPTVSVMGPTEAARWWPRGVEDSVLRLHGLDCLGCNRGYCRKGTHDCLRDITPQMVLDRCTAIGSRAA